MDQLKLFVDRVLHQRYRITRQLGRGGMGAVYEAEDLAEKRLVAIKQMLPLDLDLRQSFEREAKILSEVEHPGLPRVTDFFENETGLFMVMDYVAGDNLGQLLDSRRVPFAPHQVRRWAEELLDILDYLHNRSPRVIHRDVKPTNLKLSAQGRLTLLDFGLAKEWTEEDERNGVITNMCILAYTPNYAPLEQIQGEGTSARSDIYALGATLYHLLTGQPPTDALKRANRILCDGRDPLQPVNQLIHGIPAPLAALVMKALALKPSARPSTAAEMRRQLSSGVIAPDFSRNASPLARPERAQQKAAEPEEVTRLAQVAVAGGGGGVAAQIVASAGGGARGETDAHSGHERISITFPPRPVTLAPAWANQKTPQQVVPLADLRALERLKSGRREGSKLRAVKSVASSLFILAFVAFTAVVFYHSDFNPLRTDRRYQWKIPPRLTDRDVESDVARDTAPPPPPVYRPKVDRRSAGAAPALYVEEPRSRELTIEDLIKLNQASPQPRAKSSNRAPRARRTSTREETGAPVRVQPTLSTSDSLF